MSTDGDDFKSTADFLAHHASFTSRMPKTIHDLFKQLVVQEIQSQF